MNNHKFPFRAVTIWTTLVLELAALALITILLITDFLRDFTFWKSHYIQHRIFVLTFCYIIAVQLSNVSFIHHLARPELIAYNSLKTALYTLLLSAVGFMLVGTYRNDYLWVLEACGIFFVVVLLLRLTLRSVLRYYRRKGYDRINACLVGQYDDTKGILDAMRDPSLGYGPVGYFASSPDDEYPQYVPYLGDISEIESWLEAHKDEGISNIYFSQIPGYNERMEEVYRYCENNLIHFYCIPMVRTIFSRTFSLGQMGDTPLLSVRREPLSSVGNRFVKRSFDILVSGLFLVTLFPIVYVIFGLWIKLTSPGPILFRQRRSGLNNRDFWCYKFRSMAVNKDSDSVQATKGDARVTRVGRIMRKTSIDELPQFLNVLYGNMSVVGPRPHMIKHTNEYGKLIDRYMVRHFVKPGITGWAQTTGFRGETKELSEMEGRIKQDIWYIEHWSLALDLVIIFKTVYNAIHGEEKAY